MFGSRQELAAGGGVRGDALPQRDLVLVPTTGTSLLPAGPGQPVGRADGCNSQPHPMFLESATSLFAR
eukprot:354004-Chlamydomonas_euryale.AAC.1